MALQVKAGPDLPFVSHPVAAVRAVEGDFRRGSEI